MLVAEAVGRGLLGRVLQPAIGAGDAVQVLVLLLVVGGLLWQLRARPEWRLVALGTGLIMIGLMGCAPHTQTVTLQEGSWSPIRSIASSNSV
jgi:hypothetical protein